MAPPPPPFQLSATLNGHQADVCLQLYLYFQLAEEERDERGTSSSKLTESLLPLFQVRSVFSPSPSVILSSSRDKSAIAWVNNGAGWVVGRKWDGLGGFVGAVWGGEVNGEGEFDESLFFPPYENELS